MRLQVRRALLYAAGPLTAIVVIVLAVTDEVVLYRTLLGLTGGALILMAAVQRQQIGRLSRNSLRAARSLERQVSGMKANLQCLRSPANESRDEKRLELAFNSVNSRIDDLESAIETRVRDLERVLQELPRHIGEIDATIDGRVRNLEKRVLKEVFEVSEIVRAGDTRTQGQITKKGVTREDLSALNRRLSELDLAIASRGASLENKLVAFELATRLASETGNDSCRDPQEAGATTPASVGVRPSQPAGARRTLKSRWVRARHLGSEQAGPGSVELVDPAEGAREEAAARVVRKISASSLNAVNQTEALLQLYSNVQRRTYMPPASGWSMEPSGILHIVDLLGRRGDATTVLELGSGTSTIWLGYVAERTGAKVISVEHDEAFYDRTRAELSKHSLLDVVDLRLAPLAELELDGRHYRWYDPATLENITDIGLLLVDGPPKATNPLARYPALRMLRNSLSADAIVCVDDAQRSEEAETIQKWLAKYPEFSKVTHYRSRVGILATEGLESCL